MSDVYNLAGKTLVVDDIVILNGSGTTSGASALASYKATKANSTASAVSSLMAKVGARISADSIRTLDVYCYNPRKSYTTAYTAEYYVPVGYVTCDKAVIPVGITQKHISFAIPANSAYNGTWVINIYKVNQDDEAYTVRVLMVNVGTDGNNNPRMEWKDHNGNVLTDISNSWMIGSFNFDESDGISNVFVSGEGISKDEYLKSRFMQVLNDASGSDSTDFTDWATAMGCDAIFKRLAALEAFVNRLVVNQLEVGGGSEINGFFFQAKKILTDDGQGNVIDDSVFDVFYNGNKVFTVDPDSGDVRFGDKFYYNAEDGSITVYNMVIQGNSMFLGDLNCSLISTTAERSSYTDYVASTTQNLRQTYYIIQDLLNNGLSYDVYYRAEFEGVVSDVRFIKMTYTNSSNIVKTWTIFFYDRNLLAVDVSRFFTVHSIYNGSESTHSPANFLQTKNNPLAYGWQGVFIPSGYTLRIFSGVDTITVKIPSENEIGIQGITTEGTMYYTSDGTVKVILPT